MRGFRRVDVASDIANFKPHQNIASLARSVRRGGSGRRSQQKMCSCPRLFVLSRAPAAALSLSLSLQDPYTSSWNEHTCPSPAEREREREECYLRNRRASVFWMPTKRKREKEREREGKSCGALSFNTTHVRRSLHIEHVARAHERIRLRHFLSTNRLLRAFCFFFFRLKQQYLMQQQ